MANVTIFLPDDTKKRMLKSKGVNWSGAFRSFVEDRLDALEELDGLAAKNAMAWDEAKKIATKINAGMGRHARALLHETGK